MNYEFQAHLDGGKYEKRVWYWPFKWYVEPSVLCTDDWTRSDIYFQTHYPIQYFLRSTCREFYFKQFHRLKELKWNVKGILRNPRKEMRDKVFPIRWNDLVESIVIFHLEAIIEFVDREKCFEQINYTSDKDHEEFANGLRECYHYAKFTRAQLHERLEKAYDKVPIDGTCYKEAYKEVIIIENDIKEYDTKVCEWVIKNRHMFWC